MNIEHHFCLDESPQFHMMELGHVDSTNQFARHYRPVRPVRISLVTAEYQSAGKGAGTNSWESAEGENLLFSLIVRPTMVQASHLFVLSEAMALSVCKALDNFGTGFSIKWPNDVYHHDSKIAGMLIENDIVGHHIDRSILGVGININQTTFLSDAPNPISLAQILGEPIERIFIMEAVMEQFSSLYTMMEHGREKELHRQYLERLYRKDALHRYRDDSGTFEAQIVDVEPNGHLLLQDQEGRTRRYAFKEVSFII